MLLISAPVFIGDPVSRSFLEQAQDLGGVMANTLELTYKSLELTYKSKEGAAAPGGRLEDALHQLHSAAAPLLQLLNPKVRDSIKRIGRNTEE